MWTGSVLRKVFNINNKIELKKFKSLIYRRYLSITSVCRENIRNNILFNPEDIVIPNVSIPELIYSHIEPYWNLTAFECPLTNRKFTFGEIRKASRNLSKVLRKKFQLNKGDVALIYLANSPEFPIATLGCLEAGIVASTANSLYTSEEVLKQLKDCSAKLIITSYELYENARKASTQLDYKLPIVCVRTLRDQSLPEGTIDFTEIINTNIDIPDLEFPNAEDIAILPYSSGTTGLPKGVELTHRNIVSNLIQTESFAADLLEAAHGNFQEVSPGVLPMFHIYGFSITMLKLMLKGAKLVTIPRFSPQIYIDVLKNYPITLIFAAPPLVLFLTHHPDVKLEYMKSLRTVMSGAAPLGATDEGHFLEKVGDHILIFQGYGLTETSPVVTMCPKDVKKKYGPKADGSIGLVVPETEVKIIKTGDKNAIALGPNLEGELLVKGPQVMKGYHKKPEATKETFNNEWFKTGDLAYYNEDGLVFITDRVKELIKVRGYQVAPAELEQILRNHPKVADAAVIGIPNEISGEIPRAYIQMKNNYETNNNNTDEIYKFVAEKVAKYKRLDGGIEIVKEIPKNASGKILRRKLKENYLNEQ